MNLPVWSNSRSCVAAAAYAGPLVLPRDSANTWPFELTATPVSSPKYMPSGSFSGSGVESNWISGTWARAKGATASRPKRTFLIRKPPLSPSYAAIRATGLERIEVGRHFSSLLVAREGRLTGAEVVLHVLGPRGA